MIGLFAVYKSFSVSNHCFVDERGLLALGSWSSAMAVGGDDKGDVGDGDDYGGNVDSNIYMVPVMEKIVV